MEFDASRVLAEAMGEVRAAASEISRLLEAAPRADTGALDSLCSQLDAVAFRARALALEARIEGLRRGQGAARKQCEARYIPAPPLASPRGGIQSA
jgi:hypothetical protein